MDMSVGASDAPVSLGPAVQVLLPDSPASDRATRLAGPPKRDKFGIGLLVLLADETAPNVRCVKPGVTNAVRTAVRFSVAVSSAYLYCCQILHQQRLTVDVEGSSLRLVELASGAETVRGCTLAAGGSAWPSSRSVTLWVEGSPRRVGRRSLGGVPEAEDQAGDESCEIKLGSLSK